LASVGPLIAALVALKLVVLALDPTIRLYLGDSAAYLYGAMDSGRLPDDRSFTYSLLIRGLVRPFESLWALVGWQTLAGIGVAVLGWVTLVRRLAVPPRLAAIAVCIFALEPAQLYYERMVLAETFGLLAFTAFFVAAGVYLVSHRIWWLPVVALLGLMAATLRLNYVPVVLVISTTLPLLRLFEAVPPRWQQVAGHTLVAVCAVAAMHLTFQQWVAMIFSSPPGYIARAGFMQLGLVTPLVKPEHFARVGLPADLGSKLAYPINDPVARMRHMWSPGGLVRELRSRNVALEPVSRELARMAIADDPFGLVRLGVHTVADFFRPEGIEHALDNDLGRRTIPDDVLWSLREEWAYDATDLPTRVTPVSWYFEKGTWWLVACLLVLAPVAAWNVVRSWHTPQRTQAMLGALFGVGLVLAHILFVPVALYRYIHPLPFFLMVNGLSAFSFRRREPRAKSREPRAESRELRAESRELRADS
jgi:hypothetical protein